MLDTKGCSRKYRKRKKLATDRKIKESLTTQLEKEKAMELQLSQQEQEWQKEGHKVQLETDQATSHLIQAQYKMQNTEQKFDQESGTFRHQDIAEKVDLISQSKILNLEAQQAINMWCDFIQQTKQSSPSIIQTTFKISTKSEKSKEVDETSKGSPGTTEQSGNKL
jgi:hypothetical protein